MTNQVLYVLFACFLAGAAVIAVLYVRLLFGKRDAFAVCSVALGEVGVKSRVKKTMSYKKPTLWVIAACLLLCAVVAVLFLTDPKSEETPSEVASDVTSEVTSEVTSDVTSDESVLEVTSEESFAEASSDESLPEESSEPEESSAPEESSEPEPQDEEPKEPVVTDDEVVTLGQFHHAVLYLPFHTNDDLPDDLIKALGGNPIESDFLNEYGETGMSSAEFWDVWEKYEPYYQSEIVSAIDALCADMGEEHRDALVALSDATYQRYEKMSLMHADTFHKSLDGGHMGTMYSLVEGDAKMDAYRQTLHQIKYLHYLYEMHTEGVASDALTFAYTPVYARKTQTLLIVSKSNRYVIEGSFTDRNSTNVFFEAMKSNPIDASDPMHVAYWEQQIDAAKELLAAYYDETEQQEIDAYCKMYLDAPTEWLQVLSLFDEAGCIELKQETRDAITADSYRQALFELKYLAFLWEYKDGMGEPDASLRFGEYVEPAKITPEETATYLNGEELAVVQAKLYNGSKGVPILQSGIKIWICDEDRNPIDYRYTNCYGIAWFAMPVGNYYFMFEGNEEYQACESTKYASSIKWQDYRGHADYYEVVGIYNSPFVVPVPRYYSKTRVASKSVQEVIIALKPVE